MNFTEWVIVLVVSLGVVAGLNTASDWQKERNKERVQKQVDMILQGDELFPMYQPLEVIPDEIKKERCKQSKECFKLVEALVYEARSETREGQIAVASVILNRVDHPNFPDTIWGVVTQPYQFSYVGFEHLQQQPSEQDWEKSSIVAYDVKHGLVERLDGVYFYLNKQTLGYKLPRWTIEYTEVETIGMHTFYTW